MTNPVIDHRSKYPANSILRKPSTHTRRGKIPIVVKSFEEREKERIERRTRKKLTISEAKRVISELQKTKLEFAEYRKKTSLKFNDRPIYKKGMGSEFYNTREWRNLRWKVLDKFGGKCSVCGRNNKEHGVILHIDHIKPRSRFPELELEFDNMQVLCEDCNLGKGTKKQTF